MDAWASAAWSSFFIFILVYLGFFVVTTLVVRLVIRRRLANLKGITLTNTISVAISYCLFLLFFFVQLGPFWGNIIGFRPLLVTAIITLILLEVYDFVKGKLGTDQINLISGALKRILVLVPVSIVVIVISLLVKSIYIYFSSPLIEDPYLFTQNFDPKNSKPTIVSTSRGLSLIGDGASYYQSSLFPYMEIDIVKIYMSEPNCESHNIYMYEDTLWKVFWIRTFDCHPPYGNKQFFGPFRSEKPLPL